jgi:alkylhydroperoxidase/carboxymuconolactone decarboxylase family protein YurZ
MPEHPLKIYETVDPELYKLAMGTQKFALDEGTALPKKYKFLIAMALDASIGAADGVASLAGGAMRNGATKEEIAEALRVVQYICGTSTLYTAARALRDLFPAKPMV